MKRSELVDQFLSTTVWADWTRKPIAGDASARSYGRLCSGDTSVILMDADPANGEDTRPFAEIAAVLTKEGLCPPAILAHDSVAGLMVISDLGADDFAAWLRQKPDEARVLYRAATDVLISLHKRPTPLALTELTPTVAGEMIAILNPYYTDQSVADLVVEMTNVMAEFAPEPDTLALRDFHAENLIWRPEHVGTDRVGLLDFQDAVLAPAGYDLASLIRDVRRDVSPQLAEDVTSYFEDHAKLGPDFRAQLACLGAQRNLRILAVFARLAQVHGKRRYLDLMPRVWNNLILDLQHPSLIGLQTAVRDVLPRSDNTYLDKLQL